MAAWPLLLVLSQLPDAGPPRVAEPDAGQPMPLPLSREPVGVIDAGMPVAAPAVVPAPRAAPPPPPAAPSDAGIDQPVHEAEPVNAAPAVRIGLESGLTSWPSGNPQDLYFFVRPLLSFDSGGNFVLEAGATFNLVVADDPPTERQTDFGGILRKADWDEPSDFGQIIRQVRLGREDGPVWAKAGPVRLKTFGNGHLINRYSNVDNPDYHPAAGNAGLHIGAVRAEVFASDVFAARLFAGLAGLELGRLLASDPKWFDRFWLQLEVAHDAGAAGGPLLSDGTRLRAPAATLIQFDASAVMYRTAAAAVQAVAGFGSRVGDRPDIGAVLGLSADADLDGFLLGGKVEARKQAGTFRHGFFGPQYEISRFVGAGFSGVPLAEQVLPDNFSFYGELRLGSRGFIVGELAIEHFFWGRTDLDITVQAELFGSRVLTSARFTGIALGIFPRFSLVGDVRVRIFRSFYLVGAGGTLFFPQADGTLQRGVFVSAGAGFDFEARLGT